MCSSGRLGCIVGYPNILRVTLQCHPSIAGRVAFEAEFVKTKVTSILTSLRSDQSSDFLLAEISSNGAREVVNFEYATRICLVLCNERPVVFFSTNE